MDLPDKDVVQKIRELHIQEKVVFSGLRIKDARKVIDLYPDLNVLINLSKLEHLILGLRFFGEIFFFFQCLKIGGIIPISAPPAPGPAFFFNDTASSEMYTYAFVVSVSCL